MNTPTARERELRGIKERDRREERNTTTKKPQRNQSVTTIPDSDHTTHTRTHIQVQPHHPRGGSGSRKREGEGRGLEEPSKEGRTGGPAKLSREELNGKESTGEPPPPKPHTVRDELTHPETEGP